MKKIDLNEPPGSVSPAVLSPPVAQPKKEDAAAGLLRRFSRSKYLGQDHKRTEQSSTPPITVSTPTGIANIPRKSLSIRTTTTTSLGSGELVEEAKSDTTSSEGKEEKADQESRPTQYGPGLSNSSQELNSSIYKMEGNILAGSVESDITTENPETERVSQLGRTPHPTTAIQDVVLNDDLEDLVRRGYLTEETAYGLQMSADTVPAPEPLAHDPRLPHPKKVNNRQPADLTQRVSRAVPILDFQ
ncbi:MAG: hypothetical protein EOO77_30050 [Oxalobacteraceae bacterium]|nr:MAG: hypothetical protein EOO77_30050 [Oxalobacteraceae bacterium]